MLEDIELRIKVRVDSNSADAIVLKYLNSKDTIYPKTDMVLIPLISYWLPVACKSEEERNKNIKFCLYRLTLHQHLLQNIMSTDDEDENESESESEKQHVEPLAKKKSKSDYFATIEESKNISDSNSDASKWVNPLRQNK